MPIILSLAATTSQVFAAGPDGLYKQTDGRLEAIPQPQSQLTCCATVGDRLFVGGAPHGVAFSDDQGLNWQASWMDGVEAPVMALAPHPRADVTGVLLAASDGGGILRTADRGYSWSVANFGLHSFHIFSLAWAPPLGNVWPAWEVVFAGSEEGLYRSPNGGRGWRRCTGVSGAVQAIAMAPDFHTSGVVLVGTEDAGLWRSTDGGRAFAPVPGTPEQVNALAVNTRGWLMADAAGLWHSQDGTNWRTLAASRSVLTLAEVGGRFLAGDQESLTWISTPWDVSSV